MKKFQYLIFLYLIIYIHSCSVGTNPTKASDCKDENLSGKEKDNGVHCCYKTYKRTSDGGEGKVCDAVSKTAYENMKDYIKFSEMFNPSQSEVSIDCNSIYLSFSLISLFLLFL